MGRGAHPCETLGGVDSLISQSVATSVFRIRSRNAGRSNQLLKIARSLSLSLVFAIATLVVFRHPSSLSLSQETLILEVERGCLPSSSWLPFSGETPFLLTKDPSLS